MRTIFCVLSLFFCITIFGQNVTMQLQNGITNLEKNPQFKHAILSMYVVDSKTGKVVFDKNSEVGLAPASCQKVITSVSAFELLGKGYRYATKFYSADSQSEIIILPSGDPSFGSWRFNSTKPELIINKTLSLIKNLKPREVFSLQFANTNWSMQTIPDGWVWEDIGNYYGAGSGKFNWKENQFTINLQAKIEKNKDTSITYLTNSTIPIEFNTNELKADFSTNDDNAYVYFPENVTMPYIKGSFPTRTNSFKISAAQRAPFNEFISTFYPMLKAEGIILAPTFTPMYKMAYDFKSLKLLYTYESPSFDSLNYWFLKKSINLYGESFVKTIAYEEKKWGDTDTGLSIIKYFWKQRGVEPSAINIIDGSGLSPANRITTNALVTVMQFAKKQTWFSSFYNALPEMNGIKMKDGYISGVRSYTGYVKSKSGTDYTFAFIVNNFDGSPATVREKIWKVLDELK